MSLLKSTWWIAEPKNKGIDIDINEPMLMDAARRGNSTGFERPNSEVGFESFERRKEAQLLESEIQRFEVNAAR